MSLVGTGHKGTQPKPGEEARWRDAPQASVFRSREAIFLAATLLLGACVPMVQLGVAMTQAYSDPVVLDGSEDKVSFRTGAKVDPEPFAEDYCDEFGKEPIKLGQAAEGQFNLVWRYGCLTDDPSASYVAFDPPELRAIASHYAARDRDDLAGHYLCLSAHEGDAEAQWKFARFFEDGRGGYLKDLQYAYLWYRLSELNGWSQGESLERVSAGLSPDDLEQAQRLVAAWQPDPASCRRAAEKESREAEAL